MSSQSTGIRFFFTSWKILKVTQYNIVQTFKLKHEIMRRQNTRTSSNNDVAAADVCVAENFTESRDQRKLVGDCDEFCLQTFHIFSSELPS